MSEVLLQPGLVVERRRSDHPWSVAAGEEFSWAPAAVFPAAPDVEPWTVLSDRDGRTHYYAGQVELRFHAMETARYRDNLTSGRPLLWVAMRLREGEPPLDIAVVTADPSEGEAHTEAGNTIVETIDMPAEIAAFLAAFVDQHHVERPFFKRKRDRAPTERPPLPGGRRRPAAEPGRDRGDE